MIPLRVKYGQVSRNLYMEQENELISGRLLQKRSDKCQFNLCCSEDHTDKG